MHTTEIDDLAEGARAAGDDGFLGEQRVGEIELRGIGHRLPLAHSQASEALAEAAVQLFGAEREIEAHVELDAPAQAGRVHQRQPADAVRLVESDAERGHAAERVAEDVSLGETLAV